MNNQQVKYAKDRLTAIYAQKDRELKDKAYKSYPHPSAKEILEEIKAGRFSVLDTPKKSIYGGEDSSYLSTYLELDVLKKIEDKRGDLIQKQVQLKKHYEGLMDKLLLGDEATALKALESFRDYEV